MYIGSLIQFRYTLITLLLAMMIGGCSDSASTESLSGRVQLIDGYGREVGDNSGVEISINTGQYVTVTDKNGNWEVPELSAGSHRVHYWKDGYFQEAASWNSKNGGTHYMYQPAAFTATIDAGFPPWIDSLGNYHPAVFYFHSSDDTPGNNTPIHFLLLASRSDVFNLTIFPDSLLAIDDHTIYNHSPIDSSLDVEVTDVGQKLLRYRSGETVYIRVFPYLHLVFNGDFLSNEFSIGYRKGSNVISIVMP